uniref:Transmembrane 6 superfamily member 2 n=1 Tax=Geotrypetes seraphini TaxID=260995 RepID=A0A6P8S8F3_GEOSA|nr:transmembrane 6 superfamily member 2 [Geotrypetes seraphini]
MQFPKLSRVHCISLLAIPVSYVINNISVLSGPVSIAVTGFTVLLALAAVTYKVVQESPPQDPLFYVFAVFSFSSLIDLIISLEEDGYLSGFMREGEPYLRTAYGIIICYWDGTVHYGLYFMMLSAIVQRKNYKNIGLYWLGSLMMSMVVFLPANMIGKFGSQLRPAFLLNIPYLYLPIWAGVKIFTKPQSLPHCSVEKVMEEQKKWLHQRPLDLALVTYLLLAVSFTLFRGLVALDCPTDSCFNYLYQYEPYLKDPVGYPKMQMLVYLFYVLPFFCLCIYGLIEPGCTWMLDWTLVFAGAVTQAQFSHIGSSLHHKTPYTYRIPEDTWWFFMLSNLLYALGPNLLAYRCLLNPAFFMAPKEVVEDQNDKKHK